MRGGRRNKQKIWRGFGKKIMDIIIRKPKEKEYEQVVKVVNSEKSLYGKVFSKKELDEIGIGNFKINDLKDDGSRNYLVAIIKGKVVGFVSWYIKPNNIIWISMLEVDVNIHNQGIGSKLIKEVEQQARQSKQLKVKAIALEVQKKAKWAVDFYKFNGYKILDGNHLDKGLYKGTLSKKPVKNTYIFGKEINN